MKDSGASLSASLIRLSCPAALPFPRFLMMVATSSVEKSLSKKPDGSVSERPERSDWISFGLGLMLYLDVIGSQIFF